ncbi:MAG: HD domain-containing protein [Desulfovibrio sp.]|nr:HD domain-containing protein [Desulfovibrio sp.]
MLRHTPRTGWPFLGTNSESVAEHSFRCAIIGFVLAKLAKEDPAPVVTLCLFHDLHEARTGDFNYVYHRYDSANARQALMDAGAGTGFEDELVAYFDSFTEKKTRASLLANDADQLDLIANLVVELAKGNQFARDWLDSAVQRLTTKEGKMLCDTLLHTDPNHWWYNQVPKEWWIHHK